MDLTITLKDIFVLVLLPLCGFIAHQVWSANGSIKEFKAWSKGHETLDNERHSTVMTSLTELKNKK